MDNTMVLQNVSNSVLVKMTQHLQRRANYLSYNVLNKRNKHYLAGVNKCLKMLHVNYVWVTSERLIYTLQ